MTYDDYLELLEAYRMAVRLECSLGYSAELKPMAEEIREGLEDVIAKLLSEQRLIPYPVTPSSPITPDPYRGWTWTSTKPVDMTPKVTWTTASTSTTEEE